MNEFFTWTMLLTYSGAALATSLVTQFVKNLGVLSKVHTQIVSYVVALLVLIAGTFFTGALTVESAALCVLNAVVVAFASNGAYDAVAGAPKKEMPIKD